MFGCLLSFQLMQRFLSCPAFAFAFAEVGAGTQRCRCCFLQWFFCFVVFVAVVVFAAVVWTAVFPALQPAESLWLLIDAGLLSQLRIDAVLSHQFLVCSQLCQFAGIQYGDAVGVLYG